MGYIVGYVSNRICVCKTFLLQGILPSMSVGANEASLRLRGQAVRKGRLGFLGQELILNSTDEINIYFPPSGNPQLCS